VLEQQVGPGLALEPDFVTVICGANDVLLATRPDVAAYAKNFEAILARLREGAPEAMLVTATAPEGWQFMDLRPRTEKRLIEATEELNEITRAAAERHDVLCLPVAGHPALRDPATFSADGLHPSSAGHQLVAGETAKFLGHQLGIEFEMEGVGKS
jgi:lysophospholipase L1-like esterase